MKGQYYEMEGVSNSFLSVVESFIAGKKKGRQFREKSFSSFIGTMVHSIISNEISIDDIVVIPDYTYKLKGMQHQVWEKLKQGWDLEMAVKELYKTGIEKQVDELLPIWTEYQSLIEDSSDKIVINLERMDWGKCDYSDEQVKDIIIKASSAIGDWIYPSPYDNVYVFEDEIYWTHNDTGIKCKSKPDLWYIRQVSNNTTYVTLKDFKIGSGNIYDKIRDRRYVRQLAFYSEAIKAKYGYTVNEWSIIYYDIDKEEIDEIHISQNDIMCAKYGGYQTIRTDNQYVNGSSNFYCTPDRLLQLKANGSWIEPNQEYFVEGYKGLMDYLANKHYIHNFKIEIDYPF